MKKAKFKKSSFEPGQKFLMAFYFVVLLGMSTYLIHRWYFHTPKYAVGDCIEFRYHHFDTDDVFEYKIDSIGKDEYKYSGRRGYESILGLDEDRNAKKVECKAVEQ